MLETNGSVYKKTTILWVDGRDSHSGDHCSRKLLSDVARLSQCPMHEMSTNWITKTDLHYMVETLKRSGGSTLAIAGYYLEDQVSLCGLTALAEGFDVHLLCDLTVSRDQSLSATLQSRLFQAGAVPSSLWQFMYMWLTEEDRPEVALALKKMLKDVEEKHDLGLQ
jgi:hypothetical protein